MDVIHAQKTAPHASIKDIQTRFCNLIASINKKADKRAWRTNIQKRNPEQLRQFRLEDYDAYTTLKQSIINTFSVPGSKRCQEILTLNKKLDETEILRMDKILEKLSIKSKGKESSFNTSGVDVELISKMYVIEKSREKRKQLIMTARVANHKQNQPFFTYNVDNINEFERAYSPTKNDKSTPVRIPKTRKNSVDQATHLQHKIKQSVNAGSPLQQRKSRSQSTKHPLVKIFDYESAKLLNGFRQTHLIDLSQTEPYMVYDQRVQPEEGTFQLPGLDMSKITRHFEQTRSMRNSSRRVGSLS